MCALSVCSTDARREPTKQSNLGFYAQPNRAVISG